MARASPSLSDGSTMVRSATEDHPSELCLKVGAGMMSPNIAISPALTPDGSTMPTPQTPADGSSPLRTSTRSTAVRLRSGQSSEKGIAFLCFSGILVVQEDPVTLQHSWHHQGRPARGVGEALHCTIEPFASFRFDGGTCQGKLPVAAGECACRDGEDSQGRGWTEVGSLTRSHRGKSQRAAV